MKSPVITRKLAALAAAKKAAVTKKAAKPLILPAGRLSDLDRDPKRDRMAYRNVKSRDPMNFDVEVQTFASRDAMKEALKSQKDSGPAQAKYMWTALQKDVVDRNMLVYPAFQKSASTKPRKRLASDSADWDAIIDSAAKIALSYAFANAVDDAVEGSDTEEPILKRAPWGGGDHIEDYSPEVPEAFRKVVETAFESTWGKDAILADCSNFKAEGYGNEDLYGSDLAMQASGSGVSLDDDGFESKLPRGKYPLEHMHGYLYRGDDGKVLFDVENIEIDATLELRHLLLPETTEAAVKTATGGYTMTIKGGEPIDLAEVSAEDVVEALEAADLSARTQHFGSEDIVYTGDFGEVWMADWETAKGTHKEDTTPNTPLDAWCVAQLCTDKGGNTFSPAEVWIALDQRAGITTAAAATKFVKNAQSQGGFDGLSLNEGGGDPQHFHEYIGDNYGYLLDEGALSSKFSEEEIEAMDDAEKGKALLEYFFSDSTWYTDGFWMIEARPF